MNHVCVTHKKAVSSFPFTHLWKVDYFEESVSRGDIIIGSDVWIGHDVFILDGITIEDGAIIGARTVVASNVLPYTVVVGNPGVIKHYRFSPEQITKLLEIKWWDWSNDLIKQRMKDLKDVDIFLNKYYGK
jgi:acetyltransferase-like isoleucine patch superfamily enzyme